MLAVLLKEMGFRYINFLFIIIDIYYRYRVVDDRQYYYEQPMIVEQRHKYLHRMMQIE